MPVSLKMFFFLILASQMGLWLPIWNKVDLGVMAMKVYSTFPKPPGEVTQHLMVLCPKQDSHWLVSYIPAGIQFIRKKKLLSDKN